MLSQEEERASTKMRDLARSSSSRDIWQVSLSIRIPNNCILIEEDKNNMFSNQLKLSSLQNLGFVSRALIWKLHLKRWWRSQCSSFYFNFTIFLLYLGGERNRNQEFRFRFWQCRYRNFWQEKNGKFVNLWIDFREDIFPVYFYSESESYSLKSIQRITNSLAFSCQKFRYRHCRNRNRNSWFLLCSPPS